MRSDHWPGSSTAIACLPSFLFVAEHRLEADVDVVVVVGHRERRAADVEQGDDLGGCIVPWSCIRRRTVCSVIPPGSWWPSIGMPLTIAMSTALPDECSETLPELV